MKYIDEATDLGGKTVLVRVDFNVPVENGVVVNDFRIRKSLPTLTYLIEQGAKVIIIAHLGRDKDESIAAVAQALNKHMKVTFVEDVDEIQTALASNGAVILENLRQDPREKENSPEFAEELASLADIFVQDAFAACHREHASIVGVPKLLPSYGGFLLKEEVTNLTRALEPAHPSLFILGGAKFETKEPLIRKFLGVYDAVFVGGALQNEVLAASGVNVGASVVQDGVVSTEILKNDALIGVSDVVVEDAQGASRTCLVSDVKDGEIIVDIGPATMERFMATLSNYKTIVWNGPLGWYEKGYKEASIALADAISEQGKEVDGVCNVHTIVGGGDTIALLNDKAHDACTFVSTGGGAMITFLLEGDLPGLEVLN